jgi:hypothetical protein
MRTAPLAALCLLAACSSDGGADKTGDTAPADTAPQTTDTQTDTGTSTGPIGECGDVTLHDLTLLGSVALMNGLPAAGASVWIEDRAWAPQDEVLGQATTDGDGLFTLPITGLTSVEDCWGSALDYVVVAELGDQRGERGVNASLYASIQDGTLQADISGSPIEMAITSR